MEYVSLDSVQSANANQQGQIVKQELRQKVNYTGYVEIKHQRLAKGGISHKCSEINRKGFGSIIQRIYFEIYIILEVWTFIRRGLAI